MEVIQTEVLDQPTITLQKYKVKGRRRLFKYNYITTQRNLSKPDRISLPTSIHHQEKNRKRDNSQSSVRRTTSPSKTNNDILQHPSGLRLPNSLRKRLSKLTSNEKSTKKTGRCHKGRKSNNVRNRKEERRTGPVRGCLESYGFRARIPKANLVEVSTLEAEAELSDYSGTYVSTVP
jgi:hypothetical protein